MSKNKQLYWKLSLVLITLLLGAIIFVKSLPFLSGILGAVTFYILIRKQLFYLIDKKKLKNSLVALILLFEVMLFFLVPMFAVGWFLISKLEMINLNPSLFINSMNELDALVHSKLEYNLFNPENLATIASYATVLARGVLSEISSFLINTVVLIFVLYFMLLGNRKMEQYIIAILPFSTENKVKLLTEISVIVKSNALGIPILAIIQGVFAFFGYWFCGVPEPLFFALLTCFATVIPLLGTALIWFPLSVYLAITGNWGASIGLAAYALIIITNVDNLARFMLQKKIADTHPLITVFGVIIGLSLFGFWGVIFGPLLLSLFFLCLDICKKEYIENDK